MLPALAPLSATMRSKFSEICRSQRFIHPQFVDGDVIEVLPQKEQICDLLDDLDRVEIPPAQNAFQTWSTCVRIGPVSMLMVWRRLQR